jgi:hypothetical protein
MTIWSAHHMYDVFLGKYICMYMFLVTLTHKIYQTLQTRQTRANPYPYPPKPVPLARGTAEIPQGYPRQSLLTPTNTCTSTYGYGFSYSWVRVNHGFTSNYEVLQLYNKFILYHFVQFGTKKKIQINREKIKSGVNSHVQASL